MYLYLNTFAFKSDVYIGITKNLRTVIMFLKYLIYHLHESAYCVVNNILTVRKFLYFPH